MIYIFSLTRLCSCWSLPVSIKCDHFQRIWWSALSDYILRNSWSMKMYFLALENFSGIANSVILFSKGKNHLRIFSKVRNIFKASWIHLNHQVTQLLSDHGNFGAFLKRFANQQDDTCYWDLQMSETILHLLKDCQHHIEKWLLCVAA